MITAPLQEAWGTPQGGFVLLFPLFLGLERGETYLSPNRAFLMVPSSYVRTPVVPGVSEFQAVSRCDVPTPKGCVELLVTDAATRGYRLHPEGW